MVINLQYIKHVFIIAFLAIVLTYFLTVSNVTFTVPNTPIEYKLQSSGIPEDTSDCIWTGTQWINPDGKVWNGVSWN